MDIRKLVFVMMILLISLFPAQVLADEGHHHKPYVGSEAFEKMKQLVGSWEGTMDAGKGQQKITASYVLTSSDSAILEKVFEGTPNEMVSVYHDNRDKKLTMTHYCSEHNQPKLMLTGMEQSKLTMNLAKDSDIEVAKESHIHGLSIHFDGKDKMTQKWSSYEGGKEKMVVEIPYKRVQ